MSYANEEDDFETLVLFTQLVREAMQGRKPNSAGYMTADCPICLYRLGKADHKAKLWLKPDTRRWSCWRCGAKGRLRTEDLEETLRLDLPKPEVPKAKLELPEEYVALGSTEALNSVAYAPALDYVTRVRGLALSLVKELRLGACLTGKFAGRVIMPVYDVANVLKWYVGRSWRPKSSMPYLYPRGGREGVMFNERALDVTTDEPVLVVEGMFDAYALYPQGVAVLGKTTDVHLARLSRSSRPVVLVPDGDAWSEGLAQVQRLRMRGARAGLIKLPPRRDPDELAALVKEAAPQAVTAGRYVELE